MRATLLVQRAQRKRRNLPRHRIRTIDVHGVVPIGRIMRQSQHRDHRLLHFCGGRRASVSYRCGATGINKHAPVYGSGTSSSESESSVTAFTISPSSPIVANMVISESNIKEIRPTEDVRGTEPAGIACFCMRHGRRSLRDPCGVDRIRSNTHPAGCLQHRTP